MSQTLIRRMQSVWKRPWYNNLLHKRFLSVDAPLLVNVAGMPEDPRNTNHLLGFKVLTSPRMSPVSTLPNTDNLRSTPLIIKKRCYILFLLYGLVLPTTTIVSKTLRSLNTQYFLLYHPVGELYKRLIPCMSGRVASRSNFALHSTVHSGEVQPAPRRTRSPRV